MPVKPFNLSCIKKMSSEEVRLTSLLFDLSPESSSGDPVTVRIRKMLMKHLGERSFFYLDNVESLTFSSFLGSLPETVIISVMKVEPINIRLAAQIDNNLAFLLIDKLLGGTGEFAPENRPLSETEQGVLQYFVMQILSEIWKSSGSGARLHFRFEKFAFGMKDLENAGNLKDAAISLAFKVGIGDLSGFIKVIFTGDFIRKAQSLGLGKRSNAEGGHFSDRSERYGYIKTTLWADAGRVTVSSSDLITLESGDVLLFDESGLMLKEGKPCGSVELKAGRGEEASLTANIQPEGKTIKCTVAGG
ncbi:MAG: hypothetical protein COV46_03925 [Deltaproteobacteria bacterium CG11_big_fil_rev_8_21_14_0_20_49_13]|nr:MAG: hypothetical protein COV46_03925 [Deltaproteobacteria bacterium CG11_big_fil_rev_8_21_14_0_20_49_13]